MAMSPNNNQGVN